MTARFSTSQNWGDLVAQAVVDGMSERATITSGEIPIERSSRTECWVGLVLSSPVAPM
jgi:hypothetical protein